MGMQDRGRNRNELPAVALPLAAQSAQDLRYNRGDDKKSHPRGVSNEKAFRHLYGVRLRVCLRIQ